MSLFPKDELEQALPFSLTKLTSVKAREKELDFRKEKKKLGKKDPPNSSQSCEKGAKKGERRVTSHVQ